MAKLSLLNPLGYIINRPYTGSVEVKHKLFKERLSKARNLYRKDLLAHYGCVNAIEFSDEGELLISGWWKLRFRGKAPGNVLCSQGALWLFFNAILSILKMRVLC